MSLDTNIDSWLLTNNRVFLTNVMKEYGINNFITYASLTNLMYKVCFGMNARLLKLSKNLNSKQKLRDNMTKSEKSICYFAECNIILLIKYDIPQDVEQIRKIVEHASERANNMVKDIEVNNNWQLEFFDDQNNIISDYKIYN